MLKPLFIVVAGAVLLALPAVAAEYDCANKDIGVKLNGYDITIGKREAAIAEMKDEIKGSGGATEQQKKALASFEEKLEQAKTARAELLKECPAGTAP